MSRLILLALFVFTIHAHASVKPGQAGISSAHYLATEAGHEVLAMGGNAFDAAIAVSTTLAVVEPSGSGIGGGGFWMLYEAGKNRYTMVDGREVAPLAAHRDMYLDKNGKVNRDLATNGPLAAGIPGHPAAMVHLAKKYGRLPLTQSLVPAIRIAKEGFPVYKEFRKDMEKKEKILMRYPAAASQFLINGKIPPEGHILKQPDLARTLEDLGKKGFDGFYKGRVADLLVKGVQAAGGIWTHEDLATYKIIERDPVYTDYNGFTLVTTPPPSSGGVALATILNILEPMQLASHSDTQRTHLIAEAMRRAYRDRAIYLGDPDFVDIPMEMLTSKDYAAGLRAGIHPHYATPSAILPGIHSTPGGLHTTHFSLVDRDGNMVSATMSVNLSYGSRFVAPGTGFLLNNEMDDFSSKPGSPNAYGLIGADANAIEPGKRMLSSMTPTFVIGPERTAIIGTPGGSRIITMVLLGLLEFIDGKEPEAWVGRPRFHHQYMPDHISYEPNAINPETIRSLEAKGHKLKGRKKTWGNMHGVQWNRVTGDVKAASDPRSEAGRAIVQ